MIRDVISRLYVHNFRCLENFDLTLAGRSSTLLIGKNGSGKSTVRLALEVLQKIGRGTNRVGSLVTRDDFAFGRDEVPMRFEIEVVLGQRKLGYTIAFELPKGFKELRVFEEKLTADGDIVFHREAAKVSLARMGKDTATFGVDWHLAALPFLESREDALGLMKQWLAQMMILRPIPSLISGDSDGESLEPTVDLVNLGNWFSGLVADSPFTYTTIDAYLKQVMADLKGIRNPERASGFRTLILQFGSGPGTVLVPFKHLSDGEKCLFAGALVLAAAEAKASSDTPFCFWDEPDSHLALSEVGHFTMALRKGFQSNGQFVATSHSPESIQRFSSETTVLLYRKSHSEPSQVRPVAEIDVKGDLVTALTLDDLPV